MAKIEITRTVSGELHTLASNGAPETALPSLLLTYAPLWNPEMTAHIHRIPLMGIADVQQTFGYTDPLEALRHLVLEVNTHALAQPKNASEVEMYMIRKAELVRAKIDLWEETQRMLVAEASIAPLAPRAKMVQNLGAIVHPVDSTTASRTNRFAAKAAGLQYRARTMHENFFDGHDIDPSTEGFQQLADIVAERSREIAALLPLNYMLRYGRQVDFAVEARLREEGGRFFRPPFARTGGGPAWKKSTWQDPPPVPVVEPEPEGPPYDPGVGGAS